MRRYKTHCGGGKIVYKDKSYALGGMLGGLMGGAGGAAGAAGAGGLGGLVKGLGGVEGLAGKALGLLGGGAGGAAAPVMRRGGKKKRMTPSGLGFSEGGELLEQFAQRGPGNTMLEGPVTEPNDEEDEAIQRLMEVAGSPERMLQLLEVVKEDLLGETGGMPEEDGIESLNDMEDMDMDMEDEFQTGGQYGTSPYYDGDYSEIYDELEELSQPDPSTKYKEEPMFRRGGLLNI